MHRSLAAALLLVAACSGSKSSDQPKAEIAAAKAATPPPAVPKGALKPVKIENLGLELDAPEGAVASTDDDKKERYAHVEVGALMINIFAVDEFSTPSFAQAKEVDSRDKLIRDIRGEETSDGWIVMHEIESELHKGPRVEVNVRRTVGAKKWDCGASMASEDLAKMVLAACQSLR